MAIRTFQFLVRPRSLALIGARARPGSVIENLAEALAEGIVTGHSAMREFTFAPDAIDALLTYIASLARSTPKAKP
jgi:acyl-CoA synthetase (NDP forming)